MAADSNNIIQFIDYQKYLGVQVLNVYYYRVKPEGAPSTVTYAEMADAFKTKVITPLATNQADNLEHEVLEIRNLTNKLDIYVVNVGIMGGNAGEALPAFMTHAIRLLRSSLATRHGYKRYAGVTETAIVDGVVSAQSYTVYNAFAVKLAEEINVAANMILKPIILGKGFYAGMNAINAPYSDVLSAEYRGVSTQNTRKR